MKSITSLFTVLFVIQFFVCTPLISMLRAAPHRAPVRHSIPQVPRSHSRMPKPRPSSSSQQIHENLDTRIIQAQKELKNCNRRFYIASMASTASFLAQMAIIKVDPAAALPVLCAVCGTTGMSVVSYIESETAEEALTILLEEQKQSNFVADLAKSIKISS